MQFYQDELLVAVLLAHGGTEVDAEDAEHLFLTVTILVRTHLDLHNILFQQCRQDGAGYTLVFHQVFENGVVDGVGNVHHKRRI